MNHHLEIYLGNTWSKFVSLLNMYEIIWIYKVYGFQQPLVGQDFLLEYFACIYHTIQENLIFKKLCNLVVPISNMYGIFCNEDYFFKRTFY